MKIILPAIALSLALSLPAFAQDTTAAPPPPPPAADSAAPAAAPAPAMDSSAPAPAPMAGNAADTAKPDPAPTNPPVCGPGVTDRCVQSATDERMAAKDYSANLPHNDNAAMHGGLGKKATAHHRRMKKTA